MAQERRQLPDADRMSVLVAAVLLAYALTRLIETSRYSLDFDLLGVVISIPLNLTIASTLLAAGLTATGMDWLLRSHPNFEEANTLQHWLLPALTAFVIGVPLYTLPPGPAWWVSFGLGSVLLVLVFVSEYIVLDPSDVRYPVASAGLIALSYALFLILISALDYAEARLFVLEAAVFLAAGLVSLRALNLRLSSRWEFQWAIGIGLACSQVGAALHYWPLSPIQYGLMLLGPLYALTGLAINIGEEVPLQRALVEAVISLALFWAAALLLKL